MAAISVTAADVGLVSGRVTNVTAGEALTQGLPVYLKSSDGKYYKTDADDVDQAKVAGVTLTSAAANTEVVIARDGSEIDIGGTTTVGQPYYVGPTAGQIIPYADVATNNYVSLIGHGGSVNTHILLRFENTGYQAP